MKKRLIKYIDKIRPRFQKGGKLHFLQSTFDAFETFLLVPKKVTNSGSHIRDAVDMKRAMIIVVVALIPALLFGAFNVGVQHFLLANEYKSMSWAELIEAKGFWALFGYGFLKILPIIIVSYVVGLAIEFISAQIRGHEVYEGFLVTGLLIALIVPPTIPLWMLALAVAFAVIFGKEVFGGTGMNIMNPALLARAFLFFSYPSHMSGDAPWAVSADAISGATPLALASMHNIEQMPSMLDMFLGFIPGSIGETSIPMIALGALILILTGVGSFRIMISVFAGGVAMAYIMNLWGANPYMNLSPAWHLVTGGFAFGAVFMATDPVTAAQTRWGKVLYGLLIGMFAVLLRVLNPAYPEGMMLSILMMNIFAPLIDYIVVGNNIRRRLNRVKNK